VNDLVLQNVRLHCSPDSTVSITMRGGLITEIGAPAEADTVIDGQGALALPGLINAHAHIDKTVWGAPWIPTPPAATVAERIAHERRVRDQYGLPRDEYISAMVEQMIGHGTSHIQTHTDVDPGVGLRGIETVDRVAQRYARAVTITQIAFPQGGLISNPGTLELLEEAVARGVGTIGGLDPAGFDNAPNEHLDAIFDLAARTGSRIDIHLHDDGSLGAWEFQQIIDRTHHFDLPGRVSISHAFGIAHPPTQAALIDGLANAGVSLVTAAVYDRPVPPLRRLAEAGVKLAAGTDGVRDLWGPYGNGDMLEKAMHVAYRNAERTDDALDLALRTVTTDAAAIIGLDRYGLAVGSAADLVLVDAQNASEAVAGAARRTLVIKEGRVVARGGELVA
jgi:cytosine/creatinine deaminase